MAQVYIYLCAGESKKARLVSFCSRCVSQATMLQPFSGKTERNGSRNKIRYRRHTVYMYAGFENHLL